MSKLTVDQKTILILLSDSKSFFLIPDYQRPYAWESDKECLVLWNDIIEFAFPDNNADNFKKDEYFLGPIVLYKNSENNKLEIIDGQQRLTTIMLLLRAIYEKISGQEDDASQATRRNIERCLWDVDEVTEKPDKSRPKLESDVATDNDKSEFRAILQTGKCEDGKEGLYARNYKFFQKQIDDFLNSKAGYLQYLPARLLKNCVLLPIEADSQDTALRIFSTLNNRGLPLSDSDIFKSELYKFYSRNGKKDEFIKKWKELDELCEGIFHPASGTPMDELFTRYMYYERAKQGIKQSTTESLRKFYEKEHYRILKSEETFSNLIALADFWNDISKQDETRFSEEALRYLFILNYAPNGMWTYITSVYFLVNKDKDGKLRNDEFLRFLSKIIGFIWMYSITNPGVNSLRTPIYAEMVNIVNHNEVRFDNFQFDYRDARERMDHYKFLNQRQTTKSMITWWMMQDQEQERPLLETPFEIEHIYAKKRNEIEPLVDSDNLDSLGNKALLEKHINIQASAYSVSDKVKYYSGQVSKKKKYPSRTINNELFKIRPDEKFCEEDIIERKSKIIDSFMEYLSSINLIKDDIKKTYQPNRDRLEKSYDEIKSLYESLCSLISSFGDDIKRKDLELYTAFSKRKNFICIQAYKKKLLVYLNIEPGTISLINGFSRDVTKIGHYGTGNLEITINNQLDFDRAKPLLERAYREN